MALLVTLQSHDVEAVDGRPHRERCSYRKPPLEECFINDTVMVPLAFPERREKGAVFIAYTVKWSEINRSFHTMIYEDGLIQSPETVLTVSLMR